MPEFLLEIGCEELPAGWLAGLADQLRRRFEDASARERLGAGGAAVYWTPRRLVLRADVRKRQEDREVRLWGPSVRAARDATGGWSKAAAGFAAKAGVAPQDLRQLPRDPAKPGELYLLHDKVEGGRAALDVLSGVIGELLRGLAFPKRMSWDARLDDGRGALPFGRPIRWLVALLDGEPVPFAIHSTGDDGRVLVRSGGITYGHRFLPRGSAGAALSVASFQDLKDGLRRACVLLDPEERAACIRAGLGDGSASGSCEHPLIEEWRDLVEHPSVVLGRIPGEFQSLPVEVLRTVLVHHQKYLPVGAAGRVTGFAAITNTDPDVSGEIVRGMERVVVARLRDAAFFYAEDLKRPLGERVADLEGVTFHAALGSYREKALRMQRLVEAALAADTDRATVEAAREGAMLAKADLTTLMVGEFPELQGVMGGMYLRAQGHPRPEVASAVQWHYHPVGMGEADPPAGQIADAEIRLFAVVSLVDKLDTLAGYFGVGEEPTGSRDPYGLRRAAQGIVRVLLDFWAADQPRPDLRRLVGAAVDGYQGRLKVERARLETSLVAFLLDRLEYVLASRGFPIDEVRAVVQTPGVDALQDPHDCLERVRALNRVRAEARADFEHLAAAFKRASNILRGQAPQEVEQRLLSEPAERELHRAIERLEGLEGGYEARLRSLAGLRGPVDRFFDGVLVMAEEADVRSNRLGLLARTLSLFYRIADISKLGG